MAWNGSRDLGLIGALALITAARILIGAGIEISSDESYYLLWAQRLDWSYYSKGPGVALVIAGVTSLLGESEVAIRCVAGLLGFGMSLVFLRLGTELFDRRTAVWALVILNLTPIFNAGGIILTIDPLMMMFWVMFLLAAWRALRTGSLGWWVAAGAAMGAGFLCKYTILVLYPGFLAFLAVWEKHRAEFRRPGLWVMTAVVLLSMTPVVIWNAQNEWITVRHVVERAGLEKPPGNTEFPLKPLDFLEYYGMHLGVYSPLLFIGFTWATWRCIRRIRATEQECFLGLASLPVVLGYFLLAWFNAGEVNWTAPGFVGLSLLLVRYWPEWKMPEARRVPLVATAFGLAVLLTMFAVNPDVLRAAGLQWPYSKDPHWRLRGWKTLAERLEPEIEKFAAETGGDIFLIANRYQMAAPAAMYLSPDLPILRPTERHPVVHMWGEPDGKIHNQFSFWPSYFRPETLDGSQPYAGQSALFFSDEMRHLTPPGPVLASFEKVELYAWFTATRHGLPVRSWKVFACRNYRPAPPR